MTKQQMIDTIKAAEGTAWLDMANYDLENKPIVTTWAQEKDYVENDIGHAKKLAAWYSLKTLMDELKITSNFDGAHSEATDINHQIWTREQAAKGIYYDERGNRIA